MYVKPLIKVNSCLMVPPCSLAVSLALKAVSCEQHECLHQVDILVNLLGRSALLQGDLSRVMISKDDW